MQRPEHEIVSLGEGAERVLSDDAFNVIFKEYSDQCLASIVGSQPHETKLREFEYTKLQALIGFSHHLASYVEAAHNIINKDKHQSDED
jgi:hypothetical protein